MDTSIESPSPAFIRSYRMGFAIAAADMATRMGLVDLINTRVLWALANVRCRSISGSLHS